MLEVSDLQKFFDGHDGQQVRAVDGVSISVEEGHLFTLLGPSGCGKTTMLRCIAGLERAHSGEIRIDEGTVFSHRQRVNVPVHDRDIGMVFQSYALYPQMNVENNLSFGLKNSGVSKSEIAERIEKAAEIRDQISVIRKKVKK